MAKSEMEMYPLGERAVTIRCMGVMSERSYRLIDGVIQQLELHRNPAITEWTRAYTSMTVYYDPLLVYEGALLAQAGPSGPSIRWTRPNDDRSPYERVCEWLWKHLNDVFEANDVSGALTSNEEANASITVPVCFGGEFGPDLAEIASRAHMELEQTVTLFCSVVYRTQLIGFMPGFPYMEGLPSSLETPRRDEPRLELAAGSVGIAGRQTGIYPLESPGGWQVIGRTPLRLFDPHRAQPSLFKAGDRVRFQPISETMFHRMLELK